ncbi:hypothetical protein Pla22_44980 [Rubripirellula amarantea]|uniref:Tll0287-like domain-containing protein n=1 Tax=Rubripirellula amarantea TaxID=2527999 RepID=A0A5C5WEY1_9BACT|nr:DUF3365 domain-containing protein [Rubripirellula amarantea]TWT49304.1 hypothetical protein Pla22_44980 [Rubripirellula amarantea]
MNIVLSPSPLKFLCVGVLAFVAGCSRSDSTQTRSPDSTERSASIVVGQLPSEASKGKMLAAKDALFTRLSGRLMEAMGSQGPAAAIAVCQKEAPRIAEAVGTEQSLRIGRTGVRLRNADNVAPAWAENLVQAKTQTPTFVMLDNGHAAALLPIKLQGQCVMCHGPKEQIAPVVQDQLAKLYPNDRATGFKEGELRGWFWIELPGG